MSGLIRLSDPRVAIRVRVIVSGRVQGVWFRDRCQHEAQALGVRGFVRNRVDGSVEAEFEGPEAAVERMVEWCRHGPPRARVDAVNTDRIATIGEPGFRVR